MSREEKINKMIEEIKIRRNDEQYRGGPFPIYHIEFDILNEEIERLNNIKKKAINELFDLKDMIYKPETREINFDIQNKISSIIKILGSDKE